MCSHRRTRIREHLQLHQDQDQDLIVSRYPRGPPGGDSDRISGDRVGRDWTKRDRILRPPVSFVHVAKWRVLPLSALHIRMTFLSEFLNSPRMMALAEAINAPSCTLSDWYRVLSVFAWGSLPYAVGIRWSILRPTPTARHSLPRRSLWPRRPTAPQSKVVTKVHTPPSSDTTVKQLRLLPPTEP